MRITRYIHSCLVVEEAGSAVLIDPGYFSWESGLIDISSLPDLSEVVITHDHADHFHPQFVIEVLERFPELTIITTDSVRQKLSALGITRNVTTKSTASVEVFSAAHERLPAYEGQAPDNIGVHVFGKLTHPGDSLVFGVSKAVLALPITAPWGSVTSCLEAGLAALPQAVVPVHDWHWHEAARTTLYQSLDKYLASQKITFISPVDGQAAEV